MHNEHWSSCEKQTRYQTRSKALRMNGSEESPSSLAGHVNDTRESSQPSTMSADVPGSPGISSSLDSQPSSFEPETATNSRSLSCASSRKRAGRKQGQSTKKKLKGQVATDMICTDCAQIDFEKVLNVDPGDLYLNENENGIFVADLGTRCNEEPQNGCSLCNLFYKHRTICYDDSIMGHMERHRSYQLRIFSYLHKFLLQADWEDLNSLRKFDTFLLSIVSEFHSHLYLENRNEGLFCKEITRPDTALFNPRPHDSTANYSEIS